MSIVTLVVLVACGAGIWMFMKKKGRGAQAPSSLEESAAARPAPESVSADQKGDQEYESILSSLLKLNIPHPDG